MRPYLPFSRMCAALRRSCMVVILALLAALQPLNLTPFTGAMSARAADCSTNLAGLTAAMKLYNLITLADLATSSEVEGRTYVGGNFTSGNSANFALHLNNVAASDNTFVVVGNLAAGNAINLNAGSLYLGGERNNRPINFNGGGSLITDKTLSNASLTETLQGASRNLAQIASNNMATIPSGQPSALRFTVTNVNSDGLAVFNVKAADVFSNSSVQQLELTPGSAKTILINVSGSSVDWNNGNKVSNFTSPDWRARVIWNFHEATTINLNSHNFMGALLAPLANVTTTANIDGATAVRTLTTSSEIHLPLFTGSFGYACVGAATATATTPPLQTLTPTRTQTPNPIATATNTPINTTTHTPAAAPEAGAVCQITYTVTSRWDTGFVASVTVRNNGSSAINGWQVRWTFPGNQQIVNIWNGVQSQSRQSVTITNMDYNPIIGANGGTQSFGFEARFSGSNVDPTTFMLNGVLCNQSAVATNTPTTLPPTTTNTPTATSTTTRTPTLTPTTTPLPAADLAVVKYGKPARVAAGEVLTYTIVVTNTGPSPAVGVVITDPLPPGVDFQSATTGCTQAVRIVTCAVGTLPIGATRTFTIVVLVDPALRG